MSRTLQSFVWPRGRVSGRAIGGLLLLPTLLFLVLVVGLDALGLTYFRATYERFAAEHPATFQLLNIVSPAVFLGGAALAILVNALTMVQLRVRRERKALAGSFQIR